MTVHLPGWFVIGVCVLALVWWMIRAVLCWLFRHGPP